MGFWGRGEQSGRARVRQVKLRNSLTPAFNSRYLKNWPVVAADNANLPPRQRDATVNRRAAALRHHIMHLGRTTSRINETASGSFFYLGAVGKEAISVLAGRPYPFYMICSIKVTSI